MRCCACANAARIPSGWRASWRVPRACKPFEVGFAGLKDRNAVTTQHFTVPRGKRAAEEFIGLKGEGYEVLSAAPHQRKLPRGALEGNRFAITVRGLSCDAGGACASASQRIATGGVA